MSVTHRILRLRLERLWSASKSTRIKRLPTSPTLSSLVRRHTTQGQHDQRARIRPSSPRPAQDSGRGYFSRCFYE